MALPNFPTPTFVGQIYNAGPGLPSYQWNGVAWLNIGSAMMVDVFKYTAIGGETTVPVPGGYLANLGIVARGGAVQHPADDVDISSGTSILFATALSAGESILFYKFRAFSLIDALTKSQNGADIPDKAAFRLTVGGEVHLERKVVTNGGVCDFDLPAGFDDFDIDCSGMECVTGNNLALRFALGGDFIDAADTYRYSLVYGGGPTAGVGKSIASYIDGLSPGSHTAPTATRTISKIHIYPGAPTAFPSCSWSSGGFSVGLSAMQPLGGSGELISQSGRATRVRLFFLGQAFSGVFHLKGRKS